MKLKLLIISCLTSGFLQLSGQTSISFADRNPFSPDILSREVILFDEIKKPETTTKSHRSKWEHPDTEKPDLIFDLKVANDMTFFTDHYFSSGVDLKVYIPALSHWIFNKIMIPNYRDSKQYFAISFIHNLYTPIYIDTLALRSIDHPFAAYILFGYHKESFTETRRMKIVSELQLGWIGPMAGGKTFQNTLHEHISFAGPVKGWENQISSDVCMQYTAALEKGIIDTKWFELNATTGIKFGVPHTEAAAGFYGRTGYFADYFKHIGISKANKWQFWLFCSGDVNLVFYNAVLEGGIFNLHEAAALQSINHDLWHARFGGTLTYKNLKLEIAQEVISPSFPTALWHRWAYASLMIGF